MSYQQIPFEEKFGVIVQKFGYTQIPNIAVRNMREVGTRPIDFTILTYLSSYPSGDYHAVSSISSAIGAHPKTVRSAFIRMEKRRLIRRIYRTGEANIYDISGWISKIQAHANSAHTPSQQSSVVPTQILPTGSAQKIGTNKHQNKKEETMTGYEKFQKAKRDLGYN